MAGDPAGFTALYRDYLADAWHSQRSMLESAQAQQAEMVRATAHYLRSSSSVLGAHRVARVAAELEEATLASDYGRFGSLLEESRLALEEVQTELTKRLGSGVLPADKSAA
jgi:HPt (histidine-containing phosphotransfer) domain-containing protein